MSLIAKKGKYIQRQYDCFYVHGYCLGCVVWSLTKICRNLKLHLLILFFLTPVSNNWYALIYVYNLHGAVILGRVILEKTRTETKYFSLTRIHKVIHYTLSGPRNVVLHDAGLCNQRKCLVNHQRPISDQGAQLACAWIQFCTSWLPAIVRSIYLAIPLFTS